VPGRARRAGADAAACRYRCRIAVAYGTIDADYRGELLVTMWIAGDLDRYEVRDGDRIAQLVIARLAPVEVVEAAELTPTERAEGGHGSTGR
jgi:dUTP pyrophosphatase